jgi:DASS family divalent anion:Na+ symporter
MIILYSACSAICSATFATGMVSNALILDIMANANLGITWITWFKFTVLPCVILLLLLPFVVRFTCNPKVRDLSVIQKQAVANYASLGAITDREKFIIAVFGLMLSMWVFSDSIGVPIMITTLIGISIFLVTGIVTPKDILSCSSTFNSVITLGILISFVNNLIGSGVIDWFTGTITGVVDGLGKWPSFSVLAIIYFFSHYFFSGESSRIVALYASFLVTGFGLGIDKIAVAMTLAVFSSMSNVLTHYTSPVSVLMFSSGYISTKRWASCGLVLAAFIMAIWLSFIVVTATTL